MSFTYVAICSKASMKGMLIYNLLKVPTIRAICLFLSFLKYPGFLSYDICFNCGTSTSILSFFLSFSF
jgi:hypothetical protein